MSAYYNQFHSEAGFERILPMIRRKTGQGRVPMLFTIIQQLISGQSVDLAKVIAGILATVFIIFCILPVHEWAHAWAAHKLGDPTAKSQGRMSLNPLVSFDPVGALFLLLFGFGWAKPVPIDSRYFKNRRRDTALTALAGPVSNLIVAWLGALVYWGISVGTKGAMPVVRCRLSCSIY